MTLHALSGSHLDSVSRCRDSTYQQYEAQRPHRCLAWQQFRKGTVHSNNRQTHALSAARDSGLPSQSGWYGSPGHVGEKNER